MTNNTPLWSPSIDRINSSNMLRFMRHLDAELGLSFDDYQQFHRWSVDEPEMFWEQLWKFSDIRSSTPYQQVLSKGEKFTDAKWFVGAKFNFAENLLRHRSDKVALVGRLENGSRRTLTYNQLYNEVAKLAAALRKLGVTQGDRVAGFMPNVPETIIAMLATTSIGAIWSSCSPDFGIQGVLDRFEQIQPKVLFACDGYFYNGKTIDSSNTLEKIVGALPGIAKLVVIPVTGNGDCYSLNQATRFNDFTSAETDPELVFAQLPFDHPLYIMYSSGTTGVPKCIVHSAGGTLIQHLKEQQLHVDLQENDVFFYFTTCGWMMWNWMVSGLASGSTVVLYDGSPFFPGPTAMLDMAEQEKISIFGTSAKFIAAIDKAGLIPQETHDLSNLKTILSTGSPLSHESYRYVYSSIKQDICLSSISGGTDILSCFVLGNSCLPVWEGEIQCLGLGMAVEFWDDAGNAITCEKGEMVCTQPFPCAPIGFWNDDNNSKYHKAYFDNYPNIWTHGDYGEITEHGGVIIHGRSDSVLNPGGVRIGTAEIYRQVEKVNSVVESICIGQQWDDDVRVVLFVILRDGCQLTDELQLEIRQVIRQNTTPRHVPAKIIAVADIPRTISGKIVEQAVRSVVHGDSVKNTDSLANPEALELFKNLTELQ